MKKAMYIFASFLVSLFLFVGCRNSSIEGKSFVIIESSGPFFNAEDVNVIAEHIVEIKNDNSKYLIVDDSGKNITKNRIDDFPDSKEKIKNYLIKHWEENNPSDVPVESFRIVERDKYRVTNWKKEIDKFYKGERLISQITRDKDDMLTIHRREMRLEKNSSQKQKHSMKKKTMKK